MLKFHIYLTKCEQTDLKMFIRVTQKDAYPYFVR